MWITLSHVSQQHGSVYWRRGASGTLKQLDPDQSLNQLLQVCVRVCVRVCDMSVCDVM